MTIVFGISEAFIGGVILVILALIWAGSMVLSYFFANILYYIGMILFIPTALFALFSYMLKAEDLEESIKRYFSKWALSFPFPFALAIYVKKTIINHYTFLDDENHSPSGTILLYLLLAMFILTAVMALVTWYSEYVGVAIGVAIIIVLLIPSTKYKIVEVIAKEEVAEVVSYIDTQKGTRGEAAGPIILIKEEYIEEYIPEGFTIKTTSIDGKKYRYITNGVEGNTVRINLNPYHYYLLPSEPLEAPSGFYVGNRNGYIVLDENCEVYGVFKSSCKKYQWISRYEMLQSQGLGVETLLNYD